MRREIVIDRAPVLAETLAARVELMAPPAAGVTTLALALAGGSVADTLFPRLARLPLDWARVHFFWADERAVPPEHPQSNYRVARELWLRPADVPETSVHRMSADAADLEAAAAAYERQLVTVAGDPPRLDLALLGVGEDGHVASLFPGHALLAEELRLVAAVTDSPKPPPRRLTLTMPVLAGAALVVIAAFGESKAAALGAALGDPASELPVALLLRRAASSLVLLDAAAASALPPALRSPAGRSAGGASAP